MNRSTSALASSSLLLWCSALRPPVPGQSLELAAPHFCPTARTQETSARLLQPAPRPRATGSGAAHPLLRDLCLQESGGEGLGRRPTLKAETQTSAREATQGLQTHGSWQTKRNTSVMPEFGKKPAADWNDPVIHVKPSPHSSRCVQALLDAGVILCTRASLCVCSVGRSYKSEGWN